MPAQALAVNLNILALRELGRYNQRYAIWSQRMHGMTIVLCRRMRHRHGTCPYLFIRSTREPKG